MLPLHHDPERFVAGRAFSPGLLHGYLRFTLMLCNLQTRMAGGMFARMLPVRLISGFQSRQRGTGQGAVGIPLSLPRA
jgi:hypothetical protein